jgi:glutamate carboxypeptidase
MRRPSPLFATLAPALALALAAAAHAAPAKDARLWTAAEQARAGELDLLRAVVDIDSGTGDAEGGRRIAALLTPKLQALGMTVEAVPAEAPGLPDNLVATLKGKGKGRILLIGHMDTVFGPGTAAQRPFRLDAQHAYGPGVIDEKGGVIEGLFAIQLLNQLGFKDFGQITFLIETSEERGSPGSRALIGRLLKDADVELNLEPGDLPDAVTVWRKGSATYHITVAGRAAHAGVDPQDGRNAAVELIHQLQADAVFPTSGPGLTANLTVMSAGTRNNIIPDHAEGQINVRVREKADFERVAQAFRQNALTTAVPDTQVTVSAESAYPPLPSNRATDALADRAAAIYAAIGRTLGRGGNGGASESALAADAGVPALDGLGPLGGGVHASSEYLELSSLTPRLYLLSALIMDLGARPPAPLK